MADPTKLCATNSRTVADTIVGEHEHTICGYSLLKGIGDGEPVASDRFSVGGHEWVLLFYPDGKKSSHVEHGQVYPRGGPNLQLLGPQDADGIAQNANQPEERDPRAEGQQGVQNQLAQFFLPCKLCDLYLVVPFANRLDLSQADAHGQRTASIAKTIVAWTHKDLDLHSVFSLRYLFVCLHLHLLRIVVPEGLPVPCARHEAPQLRSIVRCSCPLGRYWIARYFCSHPRSAYEKAKQRAPLHACPRRDVTWPAT
jgi:hypothetical protein